MNKNFRATLLAALLVTVSLATVYIVRTPNRTVPVPVAPPTPTAAVPVPKVIDPYIRTQQPQMLTYEELVSLGKSRKVSTDLESKVHAITTTPFLSNEAYYR